MIEELAQVLHRASVRRTPVDVRPRWGDLAPAIREAYRLRAEDLIEELGLEVEQVDGDVRRLVSRWESISG